MALPGIGLAWPPPAQAAKHWAQLLEEALGKWPLGKGLFFGFCFICWEKGVCFGICENILCMLTCCLKNRSSRVRSTSAFMFSQVYFLRNDRRERINAGEAQGENIQKNVFQETEDLWVSKCLGLVAYQCWEYDVWESISTCFNHWRVCSCAIVGSI